jgi:outer membrane murein-binding lipoprotein Lpp
MTIQRTLRVVLGGAGVLSLALLSGCASKETKAIDQAKSQATTTNSPQQVQYVDSNGNTITKTVEPPAAQGQEPAVSTLITPPPPGPKPHSTDPVITPLSGSGQMVAPANQAPASAEIPAGTEVAVRIDQRISVKHSYAGEHFNGNLVEPIVSNGVVVVPKGTPVDGRIDEAHRRGHFKGRSVLELRLVSMTLNGKEYALDTHDKVETKRGKGRRSAGIIGGMTGAGMIIGGIASGGLGMGIGAAAGAGSGTAIAGLTGNRDLVIPAESVVHFRLADAVELQNP